MEGFEFREPLFLWLALLALPTFLLLRHSGGRLRFSSLALIKEVPVGARVRLMWLPEFFIALAVVVFAIALAGPRTVGGETRIQREGIAIVMAIDRSSSMAALDLSPKDEEKTRLDLVKEAFIRFVQGDEGQGGKLEGRPDDAIGLVSFAGFADPACPVTLDHDSLISIAEDLEIVTTQQEDGTALGDALGLAVARLRKVDAESKVVILLTDGVSNAGEDTPLEAANLAAAMDIKVYTIGAGTNGVAPMRVVDPFTKRSTLTQVRVEMDTQTLDQIAEITGGKSFKATDADSLDEIYNEIDSLEKSRIVEDRLVEYNEHFEFASAVALALAILGWLLGTVVFRRLP